VIFLKLCPFQPTPGAPIHPFQQTLSSVLFVYVLF
jgi:hypothetical protein